MTTDKMKIAWVILNTFNVQIQFPKKIAVLIVYFIAWTVFCFMKIIISFDFFLF